MYQRDETYISHKENQKMKKDLFHLFQIMDKVTEDGKYQDGEGLILDKIRWPYL